MRLRSKRGLAVVRRMMCAGLNPVQTFDSFVCGVGNSFACFAARDIATQVAGCSDSLLIYGGIGVGKSHLLHAVGNERFRTNPCARISCYSSERFMNEMIQALRDKKVHEFRKRLRSVDILLIDDIQFMAGKEAAQEEFFNTIDDLQREGGRVVATCRIMRERVAVIDEAIFSRLCGGVVAEIQPPDQETKLLILKRKAIENNMEMSEEVALHLSSVAIGDVRRLEGALKTLKAFTAATHQEITVELVESLLRLRNPVHQ